MITKDQQIKEVLSNSRNIAVVGCSSTPFKAAHEIPKFLQQHGYKIIPVNPFSKEILGEKSYKSISEVKEKVDIVNIFRPSEEVLGIVKEALKINTKSKDFESQGNPEKPKVIWMQLGIENKEAEKLAESHGIKVVMNKCMMVEWNRLMK
ncbi:MAG: CoA-binding protein [Nanoarchaeota archaeon]|nr:CoA-binding protein [DPANN group archaeon]MBL7116773.1 CoA-binding protein [Nanoarchaeota archaeon]